MWQHPDPAKRFNSPKHGGMAGFWRECVLCGKGSTDMEDDPNYILMVVVRPIPKKLRHLMKGVVYDNYWVVCEDKCFGSYNSLIEQNKRSAKSDRALNDWIGI